MNLLTYNILRQFRLLMTIPIGLFFSIHFAAAASHSDAPLIKHNRSETLRSCFTTTPTKRCSTSSSMCVLFPNRATV